MQSQLYKILRFNKYLVMGELYNTALLLIEIKLHIIHFYCKLLVVIYDNIPYFLLYIRIQNNLLHKILQYKKTCMRRMNKSMCVFKDITGALW